MLGGEENRLEAKLEDAPPSLGQVRENPKDGLKYVWIPPGTFVMGCSPGDSDCIGDEKPPHQVTITKGFWIGQTKVTVGAYKRFAVASGRQMPQVRKFQTTDNMPVVNVTWDEARAYCTWAGGRLPTEAEWEYAARGGSTGIRYGNFDEIAWSIKNSGHQTREVALKRANDFGLFDVLGDAWEWVNDWYDGKYYRDSPSQDPPGPASGSYGIVRGGCWACNARASRVSNRIVMGRTHRDDTNGLRCGCDVINP